MPIRRIFSPVFGVLETLEEVKENPAQTRVKSIRYQFHVPDQALLKLYEPVGHAVLRLARWTGGIQTGNIRTYLAYSFFTLIFLLWVIS